jgi:N-methylhydantoinase B
MKAIDPITAEVIRGGLATIANEMCDTMIRTATTPTFSESHDFSTAIFDGSGRIVTFADALPIHMGASKFSVMSALETFKDDLYPGDIIVVNDPYYGGSHLPDWTMMTPIFHEDRPIFFPVNRAHQGDTGGAVPGGYNPGATDIWQEGLRLPPIKIYEKGKPRNDIIKMLEINNRAPTFLGDLNAMLGSIRVAERRINEFIERYGTEVLTEYTDYIIDYAERRFRSEISKWPDGKYKGEAYLEHDCQGVQDITIRVTVTVSGDNLNIDYTGSDPQTPGFINSSVPNSHSYIFLTLSSMIDDSIPRNEGLFNPVTILLPEGSVVNPLPPAPCTACTMHAGGEIGEALAFAMEGAIPKKAYVQNIKLGMPFVTYGMNPYSNEFYIDQNVVMAGGWCNATHGCDGWGSLPAFFGAMTQATGELHDMYFPNQTLGREYITDSGGPGKWRGGLGTDTIMEAGSPIFLHTYLIGTKYPMRGFSGGKDGAPNRVVIREGTPDEMVIETTAFEEPLAGGDKIRAALGGGGGWGDPLERDPYAVLEDVLDEYVSIESARNDYGVVIKERKMKVDEKATRKQREKIIKQRSKTIKEEVKIVKYLSQEWRDYSERQINKDEKFAALAGDLTIKMNNVIKKCPDGKTHFLYWRFENGKLRETRTGLIDEMGGLKPNFTTIASYDTIMKINTAKTSVNAAVLKGKMRFKGNLVKMMKYGKAFDRFTEVRRGIPTEY